MKTLPSKHIAIIFVAFIFLASLSTNNAHALTVKLPSSQKLKKFFHFPSWLWDEFFCAHNGVSTLGQIRRAEVAYFQEHNKYVSDATESWGATFNALYINPNSWTPHHWDYRVAAQGDDFRITAKRRAGIFKNREMWFDHNGQWAGDYPLWPLKNFSFIREYFQRTYKEIRGLP